MSRVRVEVLGPLRVLVNGAPVAIAGRRERVVLALLAADAGRQLSDERLIDELWGDDPPPSALGSLQVAVSRLRKVLPDASTLAREASGYALHGVEVDAAELTMAAEALRGTPTTELLELTGTALAAWRGEPFTGLTDTPTLAHEATRLTEDRLRMVEARAEAFLQLDDPEAAARTLTPHLGQHPYRERLWLAAAMASYRCDRQAEALDTLRALRTALVDDLGVDPSASVRDLEARILAQDPRLSRPPPTQHDVPVQASRPKLVGRTDALDVIDRSLTHLTSGAGAEVLLLTGEAGIGKTTLAAELGARARELGALVLVGRCHEADVAPAYWPWLPILQDLASRSDDVPAEMTALLSVQTGGPTEPAGVEAAAAATLRTFAAVSRLLGEVDQPLVVVLEDLQWADQTSLRLIAYAVEALHARPLLVVGTMRPVDQRRSGALAQGLAELSRLRAKRLAVAPLTADEVATLVATVVPDPDPELVSVLARRCDGNPFFALELAQLLVQRGEATAEAGAALAVPDGIADVIRLRLLMLPDASRVALDVAAVAGREFDIDLLAAAHPGCRIDDLDDPLARGLVAERPEGGFAFVHALTRETVYADLPIGRRARLHAAVGSALAASLDNEPTLASEVAHHFARSAGYLPDQAERAVELGARAAREAESRGAFLEARGLWQRTLEIERRMPPDAARRHGLLLSLATAHERLSEMHDQLRTVDEAIALARAAGDPERVAEAATSYRSSGIWHWRELGMEDPHAVEVLQECLAQVTNDQLLARVWSSLGLEHYIAMRPDEADRCGRRSLEIARACGDPAVLRDCLAAREIVAGWRPGPMDEQIACARESLAVADTAEYEIAARFQLGTALHRVGRSAESDEVLAPAYEQARRLRHTGADIPLAWWRWLRAVERAEPDAADRAQEALALHRRSTIVGITEVSGLVTVAGRLGGDRVPADVVATARDHPNRGFRAAVAHALCRAGEPEQGAKLLGGFEPLRGDYTGLFAGALTVAVLAAVGAPDLEQAVAAIEPHVALTATYGSVYSLGSTALWIGIGFAALGRVDEARAAFTRAVEANAAAGCVPWEQAAREHLAALR